MVSRTAQLQAQQEALRIPQKRTSTTRNLRLQQEALKTGKTIAQIERERQIEASQKEAREKYKELQEIAEKKQEEFKGLSLSEYSEKYSTLSSDLQSFFASPLEIQSQKQQQISETISKVDKELKQATEKRKEYESKIVQAKKDYDKERTRIRELRNLGKISSKKFLNEKEKLKTDYEDAVDRFQQKKAYWKEYKRGLVEGKKLLQKNEYVSYQTILKSSAEKGDIESDRLRDVQERNELEQRYRKALETTPFKITPIKSGGEVIGTFKEYTETPAVFGEYGREKGLTVTTQKIPAIEKSLMFFDVIKKSDIEKEPEPLKVGEVGINKIQEKYFYEKVGDFAENVGDFILSSSAGKKVTDYFVGADILSSGTRSAGQKFGKVLQRTKTPIDIASDLLKDTSYIESVKSEKDVGFIEKRFQDISGITFSKKIYQKQKQLEEEDKSVTQDILEFGEQKILTPSVDVTQTLWDVPVISYPTKALKEGISTTADYVPIIKDIKSAYVSEQEKEKRIKQEYETADKLFSDRENAVKKINNLKFPTIKKYNKLIEDYEKETDVRKSEELFDQIKKLEKSKEYQKDLDKLKKDDVLRQELSMIESELKSLGFQKIETSEEGKFVWKNVKYSDKEIKQLRKGFLTKKTSEPFTSFFFRKLGTGVEEAFTDIAMYGGKSFTPFVRKTEPTPTAEIIGKVFKIGAVDVPSYTLPYVRSARILGGSTEKLISGELRSYAQDEPLEVTFAGLFAGTKVIKSGGQLLKKGELYALSKQKPVIDITFQTKGKKFSQFASYTKRELRLGGLFGQQDKGLLLAQSQTMKVGRLTGIQPTKTGATFADIIGGKGVTVSQIRSGIIFGKPEYYTTQFGFFTDPLAYGISSGRKGIVKTVQGTFESKQLSFGEVVSYRKPRIFDEKTFKQFYGGLYGKGEKIVITGTSDKLKLLTPKYDYTFQIQYNLPEDIMLSRILKGGTPKIKIKGQDLKTGITFITKKDLLSNFPTYKPSKNIIDIPKSFSDDLTKSLAGSSDDLTKPISNILSSAKETVKTGKKSVFQIPAIEFAPKLSKIKPVTFITGTQLGVTESVIKSFEPQTETTIPAYSTQSIEKNLTKTLSLTKTSQDTEQITDVTDLSTTLTTTTPATRSIISPVTTTIQKPAQITIPITSPTISYPPSLPKSPPKKTLKVGNFFDFDKTLTKPSKQKKPSSYYLLIKSKGKYKKPFKEPMKESTAKNVGAFVVDNSLSADFKLKKSKRNPQKPNIIVPLNYWNSNKDKFRTYRFRRKKKVPIKNVFIEKKQYRLDTKNEVNKITMNRLLSSRKNVFKLSKKKNNNTKRIKTAPKSLYNLLGFK